MNGNTIGAVIVIIVVVAGGWFLLSRGSAQAPTTETPVTTDTTTTTTTSTTTTVTTSMPVPETVVTYTDKGFSPKNVTIYLGTTVKFVNESTRKMWVASAVHPSHATYSGTNLGQHCPDTANTTFDECASVPAGESFSFTFNKVGTWKYHNHSSPADFGSIVVSSTTPVTAPTQVI